MIMSTYRQPGTIVTDRTFSVPLDHSRPDGDQIEVFAREVVAAGKADANLPYLLFLQGGPGSASPRAVGRDRWLDRALDDYRVLLLDQRGTGRSSRITARSLAGLKPQAQADYMALFRADSIVLDAELIRREVTGGAPWSVLGQSFGGFCTVTYLSYAPHGLREAFLTGGLPGLDTRPEDVYRLTYQTVKRRTAAHYERYPEDVARARDIAEYLAAHETRLPDGTPLTVEAFQSIGIMFGQGTGSHQLHYLLENAFDADGGIADALTYQLLPRISFAGNPLYCVLHESCHAHAGEATNWAAARVRAELPEFGFDPSGDEPLLFTGEMIYPWMVTGDPTIAPLREAAELLAERDSWPALYDPSRLAANEVPAAAAVYYDDMYVPREFSVPTAAAIRGLKPWVTNEYEHDGLGVSSGKVLDRLIAMARGEI
jgi:pimeloyl-ACP methyl ester carboxylesterase